MRVDQFGGEYKESMISDLKIKPKNRRSRGQATIEMALLLPLLLVLVLGVVEFGRLFFTHIVITNAVRRNIYYSATHSDDHDSGTGNAPKMVLAAEAENFGIADLLCPLPNRTAVLYH